MPDSTAVSSFLATVADTKNQPVFVHCGSANRVGGMWMIKRVLQDKWSVERARERGRGDRPARAGDDRVRHRVHQLPQVGMDPAEFRRHAHALVDWMATYLEQAGAVPRPAARGAWRRPPPAAGRRARAARALRGRVCGFRARPRPGADALEPSGVHGLLRELGQPAGRAGRDAGGGAQPAGDVVEDVAGVHRTRRGDAGLAARPARPAAGVRRRHLRHRVDLDAARPRGRPRARRAGSAGARRRQRRCPLRGLRLRAHAFVDRQGGA